LKKCIIVYAGQYYDAETGLHYNYFRYYDPSLGRYLRADPIGLAGGINPYVYVQNNPLNVFDPFGSLSQSYINKLGGGSNASSQWYNPSHSILGDWHSSNSTPELVKALESFPGGLALIPGGFNKAFGKQSRNDMLDTGTIEEFNLACGEALDIAWKVKVFVVIKAATIYGASYTTVYAADLLYYARQESYFYAIANPYTVNEVGIGIGDAFGGTAPETPMGQAIAAGREAGKFVGNAIK
jgi:RHS repeat-associated protein